MGGGVQAWIHPSRHPSKHWQLILRESAFRMKEAAKAKDMENPETGHQASGLGQGCRTKLTSSMEETCLWAGTSYTWEGSVGKEALVGLGSTKRALERKRTGSRYPRSWSKSPSGPQRWLLSKDGY